MDSDCPIRNPLINNDPETDDFLSNIGIEPEMKLLAFLTICILVRLALAGLVTVYSEKNITPYLTAIAAVIAIFTLGSKLGRSQWWSRKFHLVMAILILLASGRQIYQNERDLSIGYLLYTDVIFGILTFSYVYLTCPQY